MWWFSKKSLMTAQFGEVNTTTPQEKEIELEKEFLESGIPGFDDAIGNGLPIGNIYLLCGHFANGSDIFVQQVLNKRITSNDKVAYYTVEQSSNDTIDAMKLYGMDIKEYVNNNSWMFFRMLHTSLKNVSAVIPKVSTEQQISFDNISILMKHFQEKAEEGFNTCINFSPLMRNFSLKEISNFLFFMQNVVRATGGIHFVLINEDEHNPINTINTNTLTSFGQFGGLKIDTLGTEGDPMGIPNIFFVVSSIVNDPDPDSNTAPHYTIVNTAEVATQTFYVALHNSSPNVVIPSDTKLVINIPAAFEIVNANLLDDGFDKPPLAPDDPISIAFDDDSIQLTYNLTNDLAAGGYARLGITVNTPTLSTDSVYIFHSYAYGLVENGAATKQSQIGSVAEFGIRICKSGGCG